MIGAAEILAELQRRGVTVEIEEGETLHLKPRAALDDDLLNRVRERKPEILEELRRRPTACAPSCYEVERGRWIHHPEVGCRTPVSCPTPIAVWQSECPHCQGAGECSCPACTLRRTEGVVPCLLCQPLERRAWLAMTEPAIRSPGTS